MTKCAVRQRIDRDNQHKADTWDRFLFLCRIAREHGFKGVIREEP